MCPRHKSDYGQKSNSEPIETEKGRAAQGNLRCITRWKTNLPPVSVRERRYRPTRPRFDSPRTCHLSPVTCQPVTL